MLRNLSLIAALIGFSLVPCRVSALTMDQFVAICESAKAECSEVPLLQGYVGGALDMIAMLDEETDYLADVYCKPTAELFDVPTIIRYMERHRPAFADKNAMLVLIHYLEEHGGC